MKYTIICFLFFIGVSNYLHAQDKLVLRNGRTVEVKVQRSTEDYVFYTYPGETLIYERPKSVISYILFADGRREYFDDSQRVTNNNATNRASTGNSSSNRAASPSNRAVSSSNRDRVVDEEVYWQDVKTAFSETEVKGMTRLNRVSAKSSVSLKDAMQQLKKKAAELGGNIVLVMDIPENDDIEVMGIVYKDNNTGYAQRNTNERNNAPVESSSNTRRRQIAQQMESYNNESQLEFDDYSQSSRNSASARSNAQSSRNNNTQSRQTNKPAEESDAVYLLNGRVIKGTVEEFEPDDFVSIRTSNGRVYEFSMDDVKRVSQSSGGNNRRPSAPERNASASSNRGNSSRYEEDRYERYSNNRSSAQRYNNEYDDYPVSGYKGFFDAGYNLPMGKTGEKGSFEFNTSHGYQMNEFLFVGAGAGLHIYNARDTAMKNPANFPHYVGNIDSKGKIKPTDSVTYMRAVDSSFMTLPIFLDIRGYLPLQNSKITPYAMLRFGYAFNLSDGFKGMGMYLNPAVGIKYSISPMIGINFSVGYSYQSYGGIPKVGGYGYYYIKDTSKTKYEAKGAGGISLKLGIEF